MADDLLSQIDAAGEGVPGLRSTLSAMIPTGFVDEDEMDIDAGDSASQIGDGDIKRRRTSQNKAGIGFPGVLLTLIETNLTADQRKKACKVCKKLLISVDPIDGSMTLAWAKPQLVGKVCAYCIVAKNRLHATIDIKALVTMLGTEPEKNKEFFEFRDWLIEQYRSGSRSVRDLSGWDSRPKQTVTASKEVLLRKVLQGIVSNRLSNDVWKASLSPRFSKLDVPHYFGVPPPEGPLAALLHHIGFYRLARAHAADPSVYFLPRIRASSFRVCCSSDPEGR